MSAVADHGGVLPPSPSAATSDTRLCAPFPGTRVVVRVARFCCTTQTVLKRAADTTFDDRSRGQVMADTLVERVTGHPAEEPEHVALNLVMSDQALWGQDNAPAVLDGYGPIPASVAQRLVRDAVVDERSLATLRRLYRDPKSGSLVAMESRSRSFPRVWRDSSACGTERVAHRTVTHRFGIVITPHLATAADRPLPPMGWGSVNGVTTPRKHRVGESLQPTKTVCTQPNS